jgi:hypothetical protein
MPLPDQVVEPSMMVPGCASNTGTRLARIQAALSVVTRTLVDPSTVVAKRILR